MADPWDNLALSIIPQLQKTPSYGLNDVENGYKGITNALGNALKSTTNIISKAVDSLALALAAIGKTLLTQIFVFIKEIGKLFANIIMDAIKGFRQLEKAMEELIAGLKGTGLHPNVAIPQINNPNATW